MKLLITTFTYPPNIDGVAEASRQMAEGLASKGWEVHVATGHPEHRESDSGPVNVNRFNINFHDSKAASDDKEIHRYQNFVRSGNFDIIINQCWDAWPTIYLKPLFRSLSAMKVMISHGYSKHSYAWYPGLMMGFGVWLRGLRWTLFNLFPMIREYDRLIFLSNVKGMGRFFDHSVAKFLGHPGIEIVPNSIDPKLFTDSGMGFRKRHGLGAGPMVLCVANYFSNKNQKLALEIFCKAAIEGAILVFIGSELGSYGKELIRMSEAASLPGVRILILEKLSRQEIYSAYASADIFLLTSRSETQPIVLLEAMAAGIPWISTDTGCIKKMEGGVTCNTRKSLSTSLHNLFCDPNLRKSLGIAGRKASVSKYSSDMNICKYNEILLSLIKN